MNIINASFEILSKVNGEEILLDIEKAGRTCYKSEGSNSHKFVEMIIKKGHESVLEHKSISVKVICDRGISHEIVRHRIASYSQESTRFCNYAKENELTFIKPCFFDDITRGHYDYTDFLNFKHCLKIPSKLWFECIFTIEENYLLMISQGVKPQEARSILPNSLKTEIVMTMNLREWRHFFKLRAAGISEIHHPQMLELTIPMLKEFKRIIPTVFDDIEPIEPLCILKLISNMVDCSKTEE